MDKHCKHHDNISLIEHYHIESDNSKPVERRGRKAMDLKLRAHS
jgi:hypothetical protein